MGISFPHAQLQLLKPTRRKSYCLDQDKLMPNKVVPQEQRLLYIGEPVTVTANHMLTKGSIFLAV